MTGKNLFSRAVLAGIVGLVLLSTAVPSQGHHSLAAEFDLEKTVQLTGVVTKVEWTNPHTYIYIDVVAANGRTERWAWELASPNGLKRHGWTSTSVRVGDRITANGTPARDGSRKANASSIQLRDGQVLPASPMDTSNP